MSATSASGGNHIARVLGETLRVALTELKEMVLSIRAAFLIITYGAIAGGIGAFVVWLDGKMEGKLAEASQKMAELDDVKRQALIDEITKQGVISQSLAKAIIYGDLPPLVLTVLYTSTFAIPLLIILVGYNRISDDVHTRYTRYVLQRVHRGSYLAGKILGHFIVSWGSIVIVHAALFAFAAGYHVFDLGRTAEALPRIWLAMAFFVLAYVSYTVLLSSVLSPPFLVLLLGAMGLFVIRAGTWMLSFADERLGKLWIGVWDTRLWALEPKAMIAFSAYAVVFIALAELALRRRDL